MVNRFIYLGQAIELGKNRFACEIERRINAARAAFNKNRSFYENRLIPISLKRKLFVSTVSPVLTYGCETWAITRTLENKIAVAHRRWERTMLGVSVLDHRTIEWLRDRSGLKCSSLICRERKWRWAHRLAGMPYVRWARAVLEWHPRGPTRKRGRPVLKWQDAFLSSCGAHLL